MSQNRRRFAHDGGAGVAGCNGQYNNTMEVKQTLPNEIPKQQKEIFLPPLISGQGRTGG